MLLAVAGLDEEAVKGRVKTLASGDWATLPPREQAALAFARKAARPAALSAKDFAGLEEQFGASAAVDVIWWVCRAHYLTRVADAFQLPLEPQNVFDGFAVAEKTRPKK
jgi:alkylhydroperoxidase family enzyme